MRIETDSRKKSRPIATVVKGSVDFTVSAKAAVTIENAVLVRMKPNVYEVAMENTVSDSDGGNWMSGTFEEAEVFEFSNTVEIFPVTM